MDFKGHVERVKSTYREAKHLKGNPPASHLFVQMDFAEGYKCQTQVEVQSAYWNATLVTSHPVVIYYNTETSLTHRNIFYISDEQSHSSLTIFAFPKKVACTIKRIIPHVSFVHYWTD